VGKETIVRRRGATWSFHLLKMHSIEVDRENRLVSLNMPLQGTTYTLDDIEEDEEEVIVSLGSEIGRHDAGVGNTPSELRGYPLPEIQEEFERLRGRWTAVGLPEAEFDVWAERSSHEDQLRKIRRRLREVETQP
jgi:hypothetical protein